MLNQKNFYWKYKKNWVFMMCLMILTLLLNGCGNLPGAQPKTYTIGVIIESQTQTGAFDIYKSYMEKSGYIEGKNVTYINHGVIGTDAKINETEAKSMMNEKVDLLITMGTAPTLAGKKAVEGTTIPVVFVPVLDPIKEGIVTNLSHPGGNVTGVQSLNTTPKVLEWLLKIAPNTKTVYAPYNPADKVAITSIKGLPDVASQLGVELILDDVKDGDEAIAVVKTLPKNSAILFITSPSLNSSIGKIEDVAIELGIPTGTRTRGDTKAVFNFAADTKQQAELAANLTNKIFKGAKPGDLPIETLDYTLTINLKTATAIGLTIPDEIINQATINR